MMRTLYIQEAEVKRCFQLVDDADKSKTHTWCPTVKKHIKTHEEKIS